MKTSLATIALLSGALLTPWTQACEEHQKDHQHHHGNHEHQHTPLAMAESISESSLYQLDSLWRDQHSRSWSLSEFSGRNLIVTMVYAGCTTACPMLVEDVKRIYSALSAEEQAVTSMVLVTFDTLNDTPENLKAYAEARGLHQENWHFATGDEADVRTLASLLGVRYRKNPEGGYDHSNLVAVLNRQGEVIHRQEGLNQEPERAVEAIRQSL